MHLDESWAFSFDDAKHSAGLCDCAKRQISASRFLAVRFSEADTHKTLLRGVAHALAWAEYSRNENAVRIGLEVIPQAQVHTSPDWGRCAARSADFAAGQERWYGAGIGEPSGVRGG